MLKLDGGVCCKVGLCMCFAVGFLRLLKQIIYALGADYRSLYEHNGVAKLAHAGKHKAEHAGYVHERGKVTRHAQ